MVSIIIPLYNKEKFIRETLKSVSGQTYSDWECIIIDDHSTDKSYQITCEYIKEDSRFIILKNDNKGASAARNFGLKNAKGKYIQFLDADDIITKDKILSQVEILELDADCSLVTCAWGRFRDNFENYNKDLKSYKDFTSTYDFLGTFIYSKGYFPIHAYLIRREIIDKAGHWNDFLTINDDGEFIIRVIVNSKIIRFSKVGIAWYRLIWQKDLIPEQKNLSNFTNLKNVENAILSWQLIEINLQLRYSTKKIPLIEWQKKHLYLKVKNSFPGLLPKYSHFFHQQIKHNKLFYRFFYKIIRKWNEISVYSKMKL